MAPARGPVLKRPALPFSLDDDEDTSPTQQIADGHQADLDTLQNVIRDLHADLDRLRDQNAELSKTLSGLYEGMQSFVNATSDMLDGNTAPAVLQIRKNFLVEWVAFFKSALPLAAPTSDAITEPTTDEQDTRPRSVRESSIRSGPRRAEQP
ncbi:hypothetical protein MBLNU459_g0546t2 [Dothideomycetes sp. NU459]